MGRPFAAFDGEYGDVVFSGMVGGEQGQCYIYSGELRLVLESGVEQAVEASVDRLAAPLDQAVCVEGARSALPAARLSA